jgi:hypothetical protein
VTITPRTCRVVAITFRSPIQAGLIEGPHLGIIFADRPDVLVWDPGGLHMPLPEEHTILKEYPVRCERLAEDWRLAALAFGRDYPPKPSEPQASAAWVAPDGIFYACHWLEHDRLAYRLAGAYYNDPGGPRTLERRGWMRLQRDGSIIWPSSEPLTQAQVDLLFTLLQTSDGVYQSNIREELELSLTAERLRKPRPPQ